MPSTTLVHAACFALGAAVGGGIAAASLSRKRDAVAPPIPVTLARTPAGPVVELNKGGQLDVARTAENLTLAGGVLKYGNPGTLSLLFYVDYIANYLFVYAT